MRFPTPYQQVYHDIFDRRIIPAEDPDEDRTAGFYAPAGKAIMAGELVALDDEGMALPITLGPSRLAYTVVNAAPENPLTMEMTPVAELAQSMGWERLSSPEDPDQWFRLPGQVTIGGLR